MTVEEPTLLAHPDDEAVARTYAEAKGLPLQLNRLVPVGQMVVVDPTKFPFIGNREEPT
jgi:hypothetical protein